MVLVGFSIVNFLRYKVFSVISTVGDAIHLLAVDLINIKVLRVVLSIANRIAVGCTPIRFLRFSNISKSVPR